MYRVELVGERYAEFLTPVSPPGYYSGFYKTWLSVDTNSQLNAEKNTLALAQVSQLNGCKFVPVKLSNLEGLDRARDLAHYGVNSNLDLASSVLTLIDLTT